MKTSKKKIVSTLFLGIITFSLFISLFSTKGISALADITYDLNKEVLYNTFNPSYTYNNFNMNDNITIYTEDYNASYSFIDEVDGTDGIDIIYINEDTSGAGCGAEIVSDKDNHNKVINLYDTHAANRVWVTNFEVAPVSGTIEFWLYSTDVTEFTRIIPYDGASLVFQLGFYNDQVYYYDGIIKYLQGALDNTWYHFRIDYECSGGGYLGLAADTFNAIINGIVYPDLDFDNVVTSPTKFSWLSGGGGGILDGYIDAIGYSWLDNYTIGANLFPITEISSDVKQISAYEFLFEGVNDKYEFGDDNPETWTDIEDGGDDVNIAMDYSEWYNPAGSMETQSTDRVVEIAGSNSQSLGLYKDDFGLNGEFLNITFSINFTIYDAGVSMAFVKLYSSDDTKILDLRFGNVAGMRLTNYHGVTGYEQLYIGMNIEDYYQFNVFIDYEIDRAFLIMYENGVNLGYYSFPLYTLLKEGLNKIRFEQETAVGKDMTYNLDYCGIVVEGNSIIQADASYGYVELSFGGPTWNFTHHNLLSFNASGNVLIMKGIQPNAERPYFTGGAIQHIKDFTVYSNITDLINCYDMVDSVYEWTWSSIIFYFKDTFTIDYVNIEGVSLNEGLNKYWLEQSFDGVDSNESYFYVDDSNRLQFTHTANDTNVEFIQAEFNIPDTSSSDYAIKYRSDIDNNAFGYFRVNFTDISNFIPIPIYDTTTRVFISQNKTISSLIILITDEDIDSISGITDGFVSEIELLYVVGIGVSITTTNLLTIIIPLIIIFVPTFLLSSRLSKSTIVPLVMLMSLICMVTEIIPLWLFFIIVFPLSLFMFLKRGELL